MTNKIKTSDYTLTPLEKLEVDSTKPSESPNRSGIPSVAHFIYLVGESTPEFGLMYYCSIASAFEVNDFHEIRFYTNECPNNPWWDMLIDEYGSRLHVVNVNLKDLDSYLGNEVVRFSHKADILRFTLLVEFGGYYMDLDTISIKPITSIAKRSDDLVMANEVGSNKLTESRSEWNEIGIECGLSNGLMIARKGCKFLIDTLKDYHDFDKLNGHFWAIGKPTKRYYEDPSQVKVLHQEFFNYPLYYSDHLSLIYKESKVNFPRAFVTHLWDSQLRKNDLLTEAWSINNVHNSNSWYSRLVKPYLTHINKKDFDKFETPNNYV